MLRIMDGAEKAALIETFRFVVDAPEEVWVGSGDRGHYSRTASFTKGGWMKYYDKKYDYLVTDDGYAIELDVPSIESEFWYDDEFADPMPRDGDGRHDFFVRENLRRAFGVGDWRTEEYFESHRGEDGTWRFRDGARPYIFSGPAGEACSIRFQTWGDDRAAWERERFMVRELTDQELDEYLAIREVRIATFTRRLETYYRRYGDRVRSHGYWANR